MPHLFVINFKYYKVKLTATYAQHKNSDMLKQRSSNVLPFIEAAALVAISYGIKIV